MNKLIAFICLATTAISYSQVPQTDPLFTNSIVSTDIDFIQSTDPDAFTSLAFIGRENKEMPDSRNDILFDQNTFIFEATFANGNKVEIWCHSSFGTQAAAQEYADKLTPRLGKLPELMRDVLDHVVIHKGDAGAFAESEAQFFVLYSDNMDTRISDNDLEETVFHESIHATLDTDHIETIAWKKAQTDDGNFITEYAESRSSKEDLAETSIFVYTMLRYPGRLAPSTEDWVQTHLPNRLDYISKNIFAEFTLGTDNFTPNQPPSSLAVFPNPSMHTMNVMVQQLKKKNTSLNIYDMSGTFVTSIATKKGINTIELQQLPRGVYFMMMDGYEPTKIVKL